MFYHRRKVQRSANHITSYYTYVDIMFLPRRRKTEFLYKIRTEMVETNRSFCIFTTGNVFRWQDHKGAHAFSVAYGKDVNVDV